ncbi:hypothetical protein GF323_01795 [Candidatus Woesearchaeota archaeon]|nr:hypothetical protein [Candidatus Woesearchaeota archaeon]
MAEEKTHKEHEHHAHKTHKKKKNKTWQWVSAILLILLVISIFTNGFNLNQGNNPADELSPEQAGEKAISFINNNLLQPGTSAEIKNVEEEADLYKIKLDVAGREFDSYVTKDGSLLFPSVVDLNEEIQPPEDAAQAQPTEVMKSEKPEADLYVMSFCPFGNKAEDTMYPVYELLKDKVDWNIHYIVSANGDNIKSLHGQPETDQNIREVCVLKNYGMDKFWEFTTYVNKNCGSNGNCWKQAAEAAGLSSDEIQDCYDNQGIELMKAEAQASREAGATGSPTFLINGVKSRSVYSYGQPEIYKEALCAAFNKPPEECGQKISAVESAAGAAGSC